MFLAALVSLMILVSPNGSQVYAVDAVDTGQHTPGTVDAATCNNLAGSLNAPIMDQSHTIVSGDHIYICLPINKPADTPKNATP